MNGIDFGQKLGNTDFFGGVEEEKSGQKIGKNNRRESTDCSFAAFGDSFARTWWSLLPIEVRS